MEPRVSWIVILFTGCLRPPVAGMESTSRPPAGVRGMWMLTLVSPMMVTWVVVFGVWRTMNRDWLALLSKVMCSSMSRTSGSSFFQKARPARSASHDGSGAGSCFYLGVVWDKVG